MEITEVRVFPVHGEKRLKAFVSIIIDNCFIVSDLKIIQGDKRLFLSMPSKKKKDGGFRDIAHPLDNKTREMIAEKVFPRYKEELTKLDSAGPEQPPEPQIVSEEDQEEKAPSQTDFYPL